MIEIITFGLMVLALIAGTLARDYWHAERDRQRAIRMDAIVVEFTNQPLQTLTNAFGEPYETARALSGRSLYIWKAPPNDKLPRGSGLLTVIATVEADGIITELSWRDRT